MAPQKTVAIRHQNPQQQQSTTNRKDSGEQVKAKKRRSKQSSNAERQQSYDQPLNERSNLSENVVSPFNNSSESNEKVGTPVKTQPEKSTDLSTNKQTNSENQPSQNQVPSLITKEQVEVKIKKAPEPIVSAANIITKQLSTDEPDDVDAGIELDGSSNSGSSVKDMGEDNNKSTSVSPIMAQTQSAVHDSAKHAIEVAPIKQLNGSLSDPSTPSLSKKNGITTKQQLAANQQVIDADEQQLQQKLQNKQRKSSLQGTASNSLNISGCSSNINASQGNIASPQSPALCKVCEQHVYQMERMLAEKAVYHKRCFRCYQCKIQLRVDNYSSHEGQVYCKAHHRQIFQPQVKLDNEDDVDIVAKSTTKSEDDYLAHRGRLSELSFSFLQVKPQGIRKRQMIICENEPAELPKDVVRCDTKIDDGYDQLNVNLNNILEKFERGAVSSGEESQPSSAGVVIDKPSFNIKKTLLAFEKKTASLNDDDDASSRQSERPIVKKLTNINGMFNRQNSSESESSASTVKPLAIRRSESLMMRLKKYESRIAGEQVDDEDLASSDEEDVNNNSNKDGSTKPRNENQVPKKLTSINLSSLRNQWESGDISKRQQVGGENDEAMGGDSIHENGNSPSVEKNEELIRIRQQLARKKSGGESGSSIKNIYENAIKEAQLQQIQQANRRNSGDLLALNGFSTSEIQQQLLQNGSNQGSKTPTTPNKDHFQFNISKKANKLKAKFEQGLITNNSQDDSDQDDDDQEPTMSKLDQIRQEKMEDLSIFTEGEIKAREARSMFQQIDRRLTAANGPRQTPPNSRSLSTISASMRSQLLNQMSQTPNAMPSQQQQSPECHKIETKSHHLQGRPDHQVAENQPIRLTNNVRI